MEAQNNCDQLFKIPGDTIICSDGVFELDANVQGDLLSFQWKSNLGFLDSTDLTPVVNIQGNETFEFYGIFLDQTNLITNGDFELGNSGFFSSYNFNPGTGLPGMAQGSFNIDVVTPFNWTFCPPIDGNMMVVNAATVQNVNVYCTNILVNADTDYVFAADIMNINNPPPILQFSINGDLLGTPFVGLDPCTPGQFYETWNSGNATVANICIVNQNTAASGNDFALDNIFFSEICEATDSFEVRVKEITINIEEPELINCENDIVALNASVDPPNNFYQYQWSTTDGHIISNIGQASVMVDSIGLYTLTVFDQDRCERRASVLVQDDFTEPIMLLNFIDTLSCLTDEILVEVQTQNGNQITWQTPAGPIDDLPLFYATIAGEYSLKIIDPDSKCKDSIIFEIPIDTIAPATPISTNNNIDCAHETAILSIVEDPLIIEYEWNGPDVSNISENQLETNLSGIYDLRVQYRNGCYSSDTFELIEHIPQFEYDLIFDSVLNCSIPTTQLEIDIQTNNINQTWSNQTDILGGQANISVDTGGWYFVELIDSASCVFTDSVFISEDFTLPSFTSFTDTLNCNDTVANIGVVLDNMNDIIDWTGPNATTFDTPNINTKTEGTYDFVVTAENGCSTNASVFVPFEDLIPKLEIIGFDTIDCNAPISVLEANSDISLSNFYWQTPSGIEDQVSQVNADMAGRYTFFGTALDGCDATAEIQIVTDTIKPTLVFNPATTLNCLNEELEFTFSSGATLTHIDWLKDGISFSTEPSVTINQEGQYELEITATNGCKQSKTFTIDIDTISPILNIEFDTITCSNPEATILAIDTLDQSYQIENLESGNSINNNMLLTSEAGRYRITAFAANGCTTTKMINVVTDTITPPLEVTSNIINCYNPSTEVSITNPNPDLIYRFYEGNNLIAENTSITIDEATNLTVEAIANNGCINVKTHAVTLDTTSLDFSLSTDTLTCNVNSVSINTFPNIPNQGYSWTYNDSPYSDQYIVNPDQAGWYHLTITNISNGCISFDSIEVIEIDNTPNTFDFKIEDPFCADSVFLLKQLEIDGGIPDYQVSLNNGAFEFFQGQSFELMEGQNLITIRDRYECVLDTTISLVLSPILELELEPEITIDWYTDHQLNLTINKPWEEITEIVWDPAMFLSCSDCPDPIVQLADSQNFQVSLTDIFGCVAFANVFISVEKNLNIFIPNVFSPHNQDLINDLFKPLGKSRDINQILNFEIYDRWGNQVFSQENLAIDDAELGWNGTFLGTALNPSVFAYVIEVEWADLTVQTFVGNVTIID